MIATQSIAIKVKLAAAGTIPVVADYIDTVAATGEWLDAQTVHSVTAGTSEVTIAAATLVTKATIAKVRKLNTFHSVNDSGAAATLTIYQDDETNERNAMVFVLADGDQVQFAKGKWKVLTSAGARKEIGSGGGESHVFLHMGA